MTEDKDEKNLERWQPSDNDRTQSEKALRKAGEQMADLQTGIRAAMEQFAEQWEEARAKLAAAFERINIVIAPPIPDIEKAKVVFREHGFCIAPSAVYPPHHQSRIQRMGTGLWRCQAYHRPTGQVGASLSHPHHPRFFISQSKQARGERRKKHNNGELMDRRRGAILQPGVAQKPNVGLAHFLTVATNKIN
jgi:hypothetical protein